MRKQASNSTDNLSGGPPHQLPPIAASAASRPPGLTPIFNSAAQKTDNSKKLKNSLSKEDVERKIKLLQKRMSANRPVFSPTPLGNVENTINKKQDRIISQEIKRLQQQRHAMEVWTQNSMAQKFNRAAGRSM